MAINPSGIFGETPYKLSRTNNLLYITTKSSYLFYIILFILLPFILIISISITLEFLIFLIPILSLPFINDGWKFPSRVKFDSNHRIVTLFRPFFLWRTMDYKEINNVVVSKTVQSSGTSPFEDGNKDFIYRIYLLLNNDHSYRLIKIKTRKEIPEKINGIIEFIQQLIK